MAAVSQRVHGSAASSAGQASSAPVFEFVCLFTRDLRKKQKRWHDGRIKYHVFNKRIMVYDERGNFIGDTHWREDHDFDEGEELQLERGGVIVQAAECVGSRNQDLSELIDKRVQEKAQRQSAAAARHSSPLAPAAVPRPSHAPSSHLQMHSRPLHNVVGTPTGHYGRAMLPAESPYEQRQRQNAEQANADDDESPRPAKRRKRDISPPTRSGYAQNLFGATLSLSAVPMSSAPARHQPRKAVQILGNLSFPMPSGPDDEDSDVEGRQDTPPNVHVPRPNPRPLAESMVLPNVSQPAVNPRRPKHVAQNPREPVPLVRGNTRDDPIAIDLASSQEESYNASKQTRETADSAIPRPIDRFSLHSKSKPKELGREATRDRASCNQFDLDKPESKALVRATDNSTAEDQDAGRRRPVTVKEATMSKNLEGPLATSTGSVPRAKETTCNAETRIELRVKSRKRRGLLMVSEKSTSKKAKKTGGPDPGSSFSVLESSPPPQGANANDQPHVDELGLGVPPSRQALPTGETTQKLPSKHHADPLRETEADADQTHGHQFPIARSDDEAEASCLGVTPQTSEAQNATRPVKPGRMTLDNHSVTIPPENVHTDERCYSSDDPFEVMNTVSQTKGHIPGSRQVLGAGGLGVEAPMNVDQDPKESHIDDAPRDIRIPSPESDVVSAPKEKRSSTRVSCKKSEKAPPRLARLSRKGIRSKEVIGFASDDDDDEKPVSFSTPIAQRWNDVRAQKRGKAIEERPLDTACYQEQSGRSTLREGASGWQPPEVKADDARVECRSGTASNGEASVASAVSKELATIKEPARQREDQPRSRPGAHPNEPHAGQQQHATLQETSSTNADGAAPRALPRVQTVPRLANPATRGRKAAKASDAAGQTPENILPTEPPSLLGRQPPRIPVRTGNCGGPAPELPGFSKATEGPWSREAHDLFEFTKPQ